jgi:hypothetical protein
VRRRAVRQVLAVRPGALALLAGLAVAGRGAFGAVAVLARGNASRYSKFRLQPDSCTLYNEGEKG